MTGSTENADIAGCMRSPNSSKGSSSLLFYCSFGRNSLHQENANSSEKKSGAEWNLTGQTVKLGFGKRLPKFWQHNLSQGPLTAMSPEWALFGQTTVLKVIYVYIKTFHIHYPKDCNSPQSSTGNKQITNFTTFPTFSFLRFDRRPFSCIKAPG